jgi:hypothetical protein
MLSFVLISSFICETAARMRPAANDKAEAEKILHIKRAEGEAESKNLAGVGIATLQGSIRLSWMG